MQRLSIIIPLAGNEKRMEDTLVSVLENKPDDAQVVVVLNQVYADPYNLKNEVCFVYAPIGCKTVECINRGIDAAQGEIVHVLTAGAEVSTDWVETALLHFRDQKIAAVAPLILRSDDPHLVVSAGSEYRNGGSVIRTAQGKPLAEIPHEACLTPAPDMLAGFYRKSSIDLVDRFCGDTGPAFAAVDLALKLHEAGQECVFEPKCRVYAHESMADVEPAILTALQAERLFWRWAPSRGWFRALAAHAVCLTLETIRGIPRPSMAARLAGRFFGICGLGLHGRHYRQMAQLRKRASYLHSAHAPTLSTPASTDSELLPINPPGRPSSCKESFSDNTAACDNAPSPPRRLLG